MEVSRIITVILTVTVLILIAIIPTAAATETVYTPSVEKYAILDDTTAEKMYSEAKMILADIIFWDIKCDYNDSITVDGDIYYRVTEDKYSNYESIISLLKTYFTDRCVDEILSIVPEFIEHEGNMYVVGVGIGSNIRIGDITYLGFSANENGSEIYVSTEILDDEFIPVETIVNTFRLKKEDGYLKFDSFYLDNYDFKIEFSDYHETAPKTGTPTVPLAITAAAAFAITGVILKKKRR